MKKNLIICTVILKLATSAGAALVIDQNWTVNAAIPEGNPVGITEQQTFSGLLLGSSITDVSVNLDITGGYNAGLYAYLVLQDANGNTSTEVLLNEIGTSSGNPFGSAGTGMNVTLTDAGTVNGNIHNAPGVPTGLWLADSAATLDGTFGGTTANGTWTLFLADEYSGTGTSTLVSWGLNVTAVPEASQTGWVAGIGALFLIGGSVWRQRRGVNKSLNKSV